MASSIGKSIPNITRAVNELVEAGFVNNCGYGRSKGGRRPLQYRLLSERLPLILSVAIDQYYTSAAWYNLAHHLQGDVETIPSVLTDGQPAVQQILQLIDNQLSSRQGCPVFAIGISIPGFVDSISGYNHSYTNAEPLYRLRDIVLEKWGIPVWIENDSTAIALAEKQFGAVRDSEDLLVVNLNWGVGLGMIINNKLFKGHSGYAGEFSHIPLADTNRLCSCGKKGCLEVEASLLAAIDHASERLARGENSALRKAFEKAGRISGEQLLNAADCGDQLALETIEKMAHMLGKGIATLIHIINPEYIVIGGRGAKVGTVLLPQVQSAVVRYSIERLSRHTTIAISCLEHAQLLGGVCIAINRTMWPERPPADIVYQTTSKPSKQLTI